MFPVTETRPKSVQQQPQHKRKRWPHLLLVLSSLLVLLFLLHFVAVSRSAYPLPSIVNCNDLIRNTDYTKVISLQQGKQEIEAVQMVNELNNGQPTAMVEVTSTDELHLLDVYIYSCTLQKQRPMLTQIFKQQGLVQGTATITQAHTLSLSQQDTSLSAEDNALLLPFQQNIYREYRMDSGKLVQTTFPGLYPVTSRSEAEALQDEANHGQEVPWRDPRTTAAQLAHDLFHWSSSTSATLVSNDQRTARVLLVQSQPRLEVVVKLQRLVQQDTHGLWFATSAQTADVTLNPSPLQSPQASPLTFSGTLKGFKGQTTLQLFDHTLSPMSILHTQQPQIPALTNLTLHPDGGYDATIYFSNSQHNQPGLLLLQALPFDKKQQPQLLLTNMLLG